MRFLDVYREMDVVKFTTCVRVWCVRVCVPDIFTGRMEAYNGYYFIAYI